MEAQGRRASEGDSCYGAEGFEMCSQDFHWLGLTVRAGVCFELACYVSRRELDPGVCRFANGRKWLVEGYLI